MKATLSVTFYEERGAYSWRIFGNDAMLVNTGHRKTHRESINSFKRTANTFDIRAPIEIIDGPGVQGSHAMLTRG